jgi:PadR family transcriptional regulator AphA
MDVKTLCLAVLSNGPASGYEIKKELENGPYAYFYRASFGSIYPALARLLAAGYATTHVHAQDNRPDKRVYQLTTAGRAALERAMQGPVAPDYVRSDFILMMWHADLLPPERRAALIDERIVWIETLVARMTGQGLGRRRHPGAGPEFVCGLGVAALQAERDYLRRNRRMIEDRSATLHASGGDDDVRAH